MLVANQPPSRRFGELWKGRGRSCSADLVEARAIRSASLVVPLSFCKWPTEPREERRFLRSEAKPTSPASGEPVEPSTERTEPTTLPFIHEKAPTISVGAL